MAVTQLTTLLAEQAYVDGAWIDADSGATFAVTNPATGETIANVPRCGVGGDAARDRRRRARASSLARPPRQGARRSSFAASPT